MVKYILTLVALMASHSVLSTPVHTDGIEPYYHPQELTDWIEYGRN